jgi:hypothetical protein
MCPGAQASLRTGKCAASCSSFEDESKFICPLAFWGVKRVIERHAHDAELSKVATGSSFAMVSEPTDLRPTLDLHKGGLVAGSQKVEQCQEGRGDLDSVGKLTGAH